MTSESDMDLEKKLNLFEIQCITSNFINNDVFINPELYRNSNDYELIKDLDVLMKNIANHEYRKILETEYKCLMPFKEVCKDFTLVFYEMCSQMKSNYQYLFHPNGESCPYVKQLILLFVGVAALQEFIRANISGPFVPYQAVYRVCAEFLPDSHFSNDSVIEALSRDGEVVLAKLSHPKLLYLSLMLLFGNSFNKCLTHKWWLLRCLMIHQKLLPEAIISLHKSVTSLISKQSRMEFLINKENMLAEVMFYVECAQVHLYYKEINIAKRYLISAQNVLGIGINFKLAFNKRKDSQVSFVTVKRNDKRYRSEFVASNCIFPPIHIQLDNDHKEFFDFIDQDRNSFVELLPEEQMVLLAYCDLFQWAEGCESSKEDAIILKILLSQPKIWAFQLKALLHLCKKIKPETSLNYQIIEFFKLKEQEMPPFSTRQSFIFCALPSLDCELYELLVDTEHDPEEFLSICEHQHLWAKASTMYLNGYRDRGIKTFEEQIAIKPSSLLWCYLGQICNKPEMYKVAWDLSRHTNARSQRYLGFHYTTEKKYNKSIQHCKQSLLVNPLQPEVLHVIGINAVAFANYDLAIEVFRKILELDDCNFGVWNNLTYAHIKLGQKIDACRSFLEVRYNEIVNSANYVLFQNDEVVNSNNHILLCSKIGSFREVIRFYKSKIESPPGGELILDSFDVEVLQMLLDAASGKTSLSSDIPFVGLRNSTNDLFKCLIDVMEPNIKIWDMYCSFLASTNDIQTDLNTLKTVLFLQHRILKYAFKFNYKTEDFEILLQRVIQCIKMAKSYVHDSRPSSRSLFTVIVDIKTVIKRFLRTVNNGLYQSEMSKYESELKFILKQCNYFTWQNLCNFAVD